MLNRTSIKQLCKSEISTNDLITDLKDADYVVGDLSTVLFEAMLYNCKPLLLKTDIAICSGLLGDFESVGGDMIIDVTQKNTMTEKNEFFATINT